MTGAMEAVPANGIITIESTAEGAFGQFFEISKKAYSLWESGKQPNQMEYKLFFIPWWKEASYMIDHDITYSDELDKYFHDLDRQGITLLREQRNRYAMKQRDLGDKMMREYPSTFDEAFKMALE